MSETIRHEYTADDIAAMLDTNPWDPRPEPEQEAATPVLAGEVQESTEKPLSLKQAAESLAVVKTLADALNDEVKDRRAALTKRLVSEYIAEGTTKRAVKLPDGTTVAHVILTEPSAKTDATDTEALIEWASTNAPDLVETVEHPATEAWTETVVNPKALNKFLETAKATADGAIITEAGEIVPGVIHVPAPTPSSFSVRYTKGGDATTDPLAGGRRMILDALDAGQISLDTARDTLRALSK